MDPMYGDMSHFIKDKQEKKHKRVSPKQYGKERHERTLNKFAENFPAAKKYIKNKKK